VPRQVQGGVESKIATARRFPRDSNFSLTALTSTGMTVMKDGAADGSMSTINNNTNATNMTRWRKG
jgi:hypothetical protein